MRINGKYEKLTDLEYFIPYKLSSDSVFEIDAETISLLTETSYCLGRLNEMSERLPNADNFVKAYVLKEALLFANQQAAVATKCQCSIVLSDRASQNIQ
jgi:hypothetical protein